MIWLILGLVLFLGMHSIRIVAPGWSEARKASMGEGAWKGLYSVVSIIGFVLIVWGYGIASRETGIVFVPPAWTRHIAWLLMLLSMIALAVYMLPAGKLKPILKHPMLLAVKIWALAHLLANGETVALILFGTFLAWAVVDRISLKRRAAPIASPGPVKYDIGAVVVGVALYLAFVLWAHEWLFGVNPVV